MAADHGGHKRREVMGVDRTDYLMYGAKVDYDAVDYDKHGAEMEGRQVRAFDLVVDNMSGQYAVAGKIVAKSDQYDGLEFTEITPELLPQDPGKLYADISTAFAGTVVPPLKLYLFSHYS